MSQPIDEDLSSILSDLHVASGSDLQDEMFALKSIFGDGALAAFRPSRPPSIDGSAAADDRRYLSVRTTLPQPHEAIPIRFLFTLPSTYPAESPPLMQLGTVYLGDYATDHVLYGDILRLFMASDDLFVPGHPVLYDGIERAREIAGNWYASKIAEQPPVLLEAPLSSPTRPTSPRDTSHSRTGAPNISVTFTASEPVIDRKSTFIGWVAKLDRADQVGGFLATLKSDRKVAKATHNIVAWRCRGGDGVLYQDNDDDGESAAGARLAHLLDILEVEDVLVVVSRWFGGVHLGADRFKHINEAARSALEVAGLLPNRTATRRTHSRKH